MKREHTDQKLMAKKEHNSSLPDLFIFYHKDAGELNGLFPHNSEVNQEDLLYNLSQHSLCTKPNMNYILSVLSLPPL